MADEELWKRRFQMFVLVRLIGMATFALGVAIAYTDLLRTGGWPLVGLIVAIVGAVDAVLAPRVLKKVWEQQDRGQR
jgi:membrane protein implicated in regulation of membrane protease activity